MRQNVSGRGSGRTTSSLLYAALLSRTQDVYFVTPTNMLAKHFADAFADLFKCRRGLAALDVLMPSGKQVRFRGIETQSYGYCGSVVMDHTCYESDLIGRLGTAAHLRLLRSWYAVDRMAQWNI